MSVDAWLTLAVTAVVLFALIREMIPPDIVFLGAVVILAIAKVLTPAEAFSGFASSGVVLVGALFVVAAGLRETGVLDYLGHRFLGRIQTERAALLCIAGVAISKSFILNNTSVVAILIPVIIDWCRKHRVSPSKLLMPLSFLTILGGTCTLVGTSTNIVVDSLMRREKIEPMTYFEIGYAGIPCAIIGTIYILTIGRRLLPERKEFLEQLGEARREYLVEMLVRPECRLVDNSVETAGLRRLPGLFLIEIDRRGTLIGPVGPDEVIEANDRLIFTGVVDTIVDLEKIPGLVPAADATYEVAPQRRRGRTLCEVVISPSSPLVGQDVRNANFRTLYHAAVVAVHRNGARLTNKVGDIVLHPGDTLLLQTGPSFTKVHRNNPDFYLVSDVADSRPLRFDRAWVAVAACIGMVGLLIFEVDPVLAALAAAGIMVGTRCISVSEARQAVDWSVLVMIGASFGLGAALEKSGAAKVIGGALVDATREWGPLATLAAIYFATMWLNELITNNGAAVLAFPFCIEAAKQLEVGPRPFLIAVALASSYAFASPIGYQTHMMVYGPGGYRFFDFVRVGLPLNLLLWIASVAIIPLWWPFVAATP